MTATKVGSLDDLQAISRSVRERRERYDFRVMVCSGTPCQAAGNLSLKKSLLRELENKRLTDRVQVIESGCMGFCAVGPVMTVYPGGYFYQKIKADDIEELVTSHFIDNVPVTRLMYKDEKTGEVIPLVTDLPYIKNQTLLALRNGGHINPEDINDYIYRDGYQGAHAAFTAMKPADIIAQIKESGLRGRGGGGFPTGLKWEFCSFSKSDKKYVLCNADEGDPGAFMDRSVLESDPHAIIEGMLIAARAIDAHHGYVYCRAEYPLALKRLQHAITQARDLGLLGENIFQTGFSFDLEIYKGAGAFVCGEETALMMSIEGKRGMPRPRPPFPAVSGLWGQPTILNNVETFSNVPQIILKGADKYAAIGTQAAKGTKIFSISGKVKNFGLVEVPMGTPIGKVIFDIGGGIPNGKRFKAVQLGGPSGGCLPAEHLNIPIDYEEISRAGAIMGSGGMVIMDEDTCMVDIARFFMEFCQEESCGKCTPCRVGTRRMLEILERICHGEGQHGDIELLEELAYSIKDSALCGLGQTAPNPVLSTLRYFRHEYEAHIYEKRCPAAHCSHMFTSPCQHTCPVGMDIPAYIALIKADRLDDAYTVLKRTNPFPAVCGRVCGHLCQLKCRRGQLDEPIAIKNLKRYITDNAIHPKVTPLPTTRGERIAVIGAGPAGLTAALDLRKRGYDVTVFESLPEAGGMLRWGIPEYRLPRNILHEEIQDIVNTGVRLHTNVAIGKDMSWDKLDSNYDYIFMAIGAQASSRLGIKNEDTRGVYGAVELLREYHLGHEVRFGKNVAVIGGGDSAIDAARAAIREGAESVTMFYRREAKDMTATPSEIDAALAEGVKMVYLTAPTRVVSRNGRVSGLQLAHMELGPFDRSGRRRPVPVESSFFTVDVDMVIAAVGQIAEFHCFNGNGTVETENGVIRVGRNLQTDNPRVFAGGDVVTGPAMVIDAIKAGQDAARQIDETIRRTNGEPPWVAPPEPDIEIPLEIDDDPQETPQVPMPTALVADRTSDFCEVELGYTRQQAMAEASRCLRCDATR